MLRKYRGIIITFVIAWAASFFLTYWAVGSGVWMQERKPLKSLDAFFPKTEAVGGFSEDAKVQEQIYYELCRHLVTRDVGLDDPVRDMSTSKLKEQGWSVYQDEIDDVTIFKNINGLCQVCQGKRHLGIAGEYVAVFQGPIGVQGQQMEVLNVRVDRLPVEWQEKVKRGELDFSSEQELLEALDSIDEYE
ncbi:MAG: hypothetical protein ACOYI2_08005 [Bacillota bacterium]|jgi:hypothetical protein|nr:hypothetical protein [Clostridia bacterium]